jgi:GNAT superfamily N-acetyltransferase
MIEIREQGYDRVQEFTDGVIDSFADASGHPFGYDEFAFEALDDGKRIGTINGYRLYDWLYVGYLAVAEASRGARVGSRLMDRAENLARDMALEGVALDTFRYQAPDFYAARGYTESMVIPGKTSARDRIYLHKRVDRK